MTFAVYVIFMVGFWTWYLRSCARNGDGLWKSKPPYRQARIVINVLASVFLSLFLLINRWKAKGELPFHFEDLERFVGPLNILMLFIGLLLFVVDVLVVYLEKKPPHKRKRK